MKIKVKFTLALSITLIILGIIINLLIRQVLVSNMENNINNSAKDMMNTTREYIKYRLVIKGLDVNEEGINEEAINIVKYISLNYQCVVQITNMKGDLLESSSYEEFEEVVEGSIERAANG
ncbi:MAG: histidine kinase, partial [Clostridium sp.]